MQGRQFCYDVFSFLASRGLTLNGRIHFLVSSFFPYRMVYRKENRKSKKVVFPVKMAWISSRCIICFNYCIQSHSHLLCQKQVVYIEKRKKLFVQEFQYSYCMALDSQSDLFFLRLGNVFIFFWFLFTLLPFKLECLTSRVYFKQWMTDL